MVLGLIAATLCKSQNAHSKPVLYKSKAMPTKVGWFNDVNYPIEHMTLMLVYCSHSVLPSLIR